MVFEVVDLTGDTITPRIRVEAATPEGAVLSAMGVEVQRNGDRRDLVARVYWRTPGNTNMVRLYRLHSSSLEQSPSSSKFARDHQT